MDSGNGEKEGLLTSQGSLKMKGRGGVSQNSPCWVGVGVKQAVH